MDEPPRDNLGKRQHDLNTKVNEAYAKKIKFDDVKDETECSEVDNFFKIDLAAKYRNLDYIIEVLKTKDTLYVHRALKKCKWIYTDQYSGIINPEYLENNIFPVTSMRVKRLILKTVVMHMRNEDRAASFYNYCMKVKITDIALKCLLFTSEEFKLALMRNQNNAHLNDILRKKFIYVQFIVGKSFPLLEAYMAILTDNHEGMLLKFRIFYPMNNDKYLDLLEKYVQFNEIYSPGHRPTKLNRDMCEHIMKKHKDRVLGKPIFYLSTIPTEILIRHITPEDAKILIIAILPSTVEEFWQSNFHGSRAKIFLDLLPHSEILQFLKKIFEDKYPNVEFETDVYFYQQVYYRFMTPEQQEEWAVNQIKSEKQVLGVGNDYLWYRFINFSEAFEAIKKLILVTKEPEKRLNMLKTLIKIKRNDRELETLFEHYKKRHINEAKLNKIYFLDEVISCQNVFEFDEACWTAFYTLLLSVEIYNSSKPDSKENFSASLVNYKTVILCYHILNEKEISGDLLDFFLDDFWPNTLYSHLTILNDQKRLFLFKSLHTMSTDTIDEYKNKPYTLVGSSRAERHFKIIVNLLEMFSVSPKTYKKQPRIQYKRPRFEHPHISDRQLLLDLKNDKSIVNEKLLEVKTMLQRDKTLVINNFLNKIKIYFPDDITEKFLVMFEELVSEQGERLHPNAVDACINGVFKLGNQSVKVSLMQKYAPEDAHVNDYRDHQKLSIRRAICRYASNSLPPVPLSDMLAYVKGDYAHFCLHLFSVYVAALPMSTCVKLVQSVLNSPVSIQKHALRLAVQCFRADSLKNVIRDIWKKTQNVSLRGVIYKALFNRITEQNESELHGSLISLTLDLHDADQKVVFKLVQSNTIPIEFLGEFNKAAWSAIGKFKDMEPNIGRKIKVLNGIRLHLNVMDNKFVRAIIDEHLNTMFVENKLYLNYSDEDIAALHVEKWNLTVKYILARSFDSEPAECVELAQKIIRYCLDMWNEKSSGNYFHQHCCWEFIKNLNDKSIEYYTHPECLIPIYEGVLDVIQKALPLHEIYLPKWEMQLVIAVKRIMKNDAQSFVNDNKAETIKDSAAHLGKEVGLLVSEYVENKIYFISLSEKIKDLIVNRVEELLKAIFSSSTGDYTNYHNGALTSLAMALAELGTTETLLLAVLLLPSDIDNCDEYFRDNYQFVLDCVSQCSHPEIQSAAHQKLHKPFVRSPPKRKKRPNVTPSQQTRARGRGNSRRGRKK